MIAGTNTGAGTKRLPAHVRTKANPVRQGEPLFADKDMHPKWNLRRFPFILDYRVIQYERETLHSRSCVLHAHSEGLDTSQRCVLVSLGLDKNPGPMRYGDRPESPRA